MKTAMILSALLAALSASAQLTGDWGRQAPASPVMKVVMGLFGLGLFLLVWLWVIKLFRELRIKKK